MCPESSLNYYFILEVGMMTKSVALVFLLCGATAVLGAESDGANGFDDEEFGEDVAAGEHSIVAARTAGGSAAAATMLIRFCTA